tara:strand:- start:6621 stop:7079 length:459 start_codon:yes stop_codon:yes gene_type:complete
VCGIDSINGFSVGGEDNPISISQNLNLNNCCNTGPPGPPSTPCPPQPVNICLSVSGTVDNELDGIYKKFSGPGLLLDGTLFKFDFDVEKEASIHKLDREWIINAGGQYDKYKKQGDQQLPVGNDWFVMRLTNDPGLTKWESIPELSVTLIYC